MSRIMNGNSMQQHLTQPRLSRCLKLSFHHVYLWKVGHVFGPLTTLVLWFEPSGTHSPNWMPPNFALGFVCSLHAHLRWVVVLYTKLVAARLRYLLQQLIALLQEKKQVCTLLVLPAFGNEMDQVFPEIWILIPIIETGTYHLLACLLTYLPTCCGFLYTSYENVLHEFQRYALSSGNHQIWVEISLR